MVPPLRFREIVGEGSTKDTNCTKREEKEGMRLFIFQSLTFPAFHEFFVFCGQLSVFATFMPFVEAELMTKRIR